MTYFPPQGNELPIPKRLAPYETYKAAHENFVIAYTDIVLRNPETDELFLPIRGIEPEKGKRWFVGGRMNLGETTGQSAARHVLHDTGLDIAPGMFAEVSHWDIAHAGSQTRHASNTVLVANLKPEEVARLDDTLAQERLSAEYWGGAWYDPNHEDPAILPDPVRQFLRDYFDHRVMINALHGMALAEDEHRQR